MAVINGILPVSVYYTGHANPYLSSAMQGGLSGPLWPPVEFFESALPAATLHSDFPVSVSPVEITGFIVGAYSDDFYHRIHVNPARLDLGNIVTAQTSAVKIWNAFLTPQLLVNISGVEEGIELSGQATPPLNFTALQEREYTVSVTTDGAAVLDAELAWNFANGSTGKLRITGNRITAFPFPLDGNESVRERLIWATSIAQSPTAKEQRRALRISPNRELSASVVLYQHDRKYFDMMMFGWSSRIFAVPVWFDVQLIPSVINAGATVINCDTVNRDFRAGGLAILINETAFHYETVEILSISPTQLVLKRPTLNQWKLGTVLFPVRTGALINAPQITRKTDQFQLAGVEFEMMEACDWPAVMPTTMYRGWPVFDARPEESEDLTSQFQNLLLRLDNGSAFPRITDTANQALFINSFRWALYGRTERAAHRSFMYALAGRLKAVWLPTHADDLTLHDIIPIGSLTMDIEAIGYTRFAQVKKGRRDIRIQMYSGAVYYRRIGAAIELTPSIERLQLDAGFTVQINPADVMQISWLALMRGDSDAIEIEHVNDGDGLARTQQIFRSVVDEL